MCFKPLALPGLQHILLYVVLFWLLVSARRAGVLFYQGPKRLAEIPSTVNTRYMPLDYLDQPVEIFGCDMLHSQRQ